MTPVAGGLAARLAATRAAILAALASGPASLRAIERATGLGYEQVVRSANRLVAEGTLVRSDAVGLGSWYCLPGQTPPARVVPPPPLGHGGLPDLRECSLEEVGEALGLSPKAVRSVEQRALRKLAALPDVAALRALLGES